MKAFVKTNNGTFPNVNFFLAWEAFNTMGYSVTCFEEKDLDNLDITVDTPVFAGVTVFRKIINKLGIDYPPFDCYPKVLTPYYGRTIQVTTLGEVRNKFHVDNVPVFVKPIEPKKFTGAVLTSILNLIPLAKIPDETPSYTCEPIDIVSEFRVYIHDREILGVKHYYGEWNIVPDSKFINEVIKNYYPCPIAYGIDIGITKQGKSFVIEVNDGCNLGNYGLDSIYYGEMMIARWFEIVAASKIEKYIEGKLSDQKETDELYGIKSYETWNEIFHKDYGFKHKKACFKDVMISDEAKSRKAASMKVFAEDVQRRLKEETNTQEKI